MSSFYIQTLTPYSFQYQDGVENAIIRAFPNVSDNTVASLNSLFSFNISQGLFDNIKRLRVQYSGQLIGALGTKRLAVQFGTGSIAFLYDSAAITQNNVDYFIDQYLTRLTATTLLSDALVQFQPTGANNPVTLHKQRTQQTITAGSPDMSGLRPFTLFDQLGNAGDSISLITVFASIL